MRSLEQVGAGALLLVQAAHQRHLLHAVHHRQAQVEDEQGHAGDSEERQLVLNKVPLALHP
jgi:hypothetical protein